MGQKTEEIFERAKENLENKNHKHALRLFNQVLNREPSHKQALRNKGLLKVLNSDSEEAEQFLLLATKQQPEDDQLYQLLGTLYHNNGKPQKALAQFKKAIDLNEQNAAALQGAAMILAHIFGDHQRAIKFFTRALNVDSDNADLLFNRGCSFMISEKMAKAESDFRHAVALEHKKAQEMLEKYF